jgi:hypothetical protein
VRRNINGRGRAIRGGIAVLLLVGAAFLATSHMVIAILLLVGGLFTAFEALRGWCVMRACGVKTPF